MPPPEPPEPILDALQAAARPAVVLDEAAWLVWSAERESWTSAAMSSAQFVHFNAPVLAVQRNGHMEYFDEDLRRRWSSNFSRSRANLEMARLPGRANFSSEPSPEDDSSGEDFSEEDPAD